MVAGCSSADKGGCSQLCTPVTPRRWQCACLPGYELHQDGRRCIASGESQHGRALTGEAGPDVTSTPVSEQSAWKYEQILVVVHVLTHDVLLLQDVHRF